MRPVFKQVLQYMNESLNTDKWGCRQLAAGLAAFGVTRVVTCPGSRNAPLLMAIARHDSLHVTSVIDERSAAFIALGMAEISNEPVAAVCTSGSALLDFAPAVAEAYYKKLPLIIISADRPAIWIDQDDSQTIRQPGALSNIVKKTFTITGEAETADDRWYVNRCINEALLCATSGRKGPVHINISLSEPLTQEIEVDYDEHFRKISYVETPDMVPTEQARAMAAELSDRKVLIVGGFNRPSARLSRAMSTLASLPNVAVIAEGLANIHAEGCHTCVDRFALQVSRVLTTENRSLLQPDVLITFGGALVSAKMKSLLRTLQPTEHWHVGRNDTTIDCYKALTRRIEISADGFFHRVANALAHLTKIGTNHGVYADEIAKICRMAEETAVARQLPWSGSLVIDILTRAIPAQWNLQLSNGMTVRQAMNCNLTKFHRVDCNRGVSGIDGSVSTALGASVAYDHPTLLVTGDMSMQYDFMALTSTLLSPKLKIVVMNNGGGGIFHYVKGTAKLREMPALLNGSLNLPLEKLAATYNLAYAKAYDTESLYAAIKLLKATQSRPVLVEVCTDADIDAGCL